MTHRKLFFFASALLALGAASTLQAQTNLYVGSNSSGVRLQAPSGTNTYTNTYVGFEGGANSNALGVYNAGTVLSNRAGVFVGYGGSGNSVVISNGGIVRSIANSSIGFSNTASNNIVLVTGAGSAWTNGAAFRVGESGNGNSLVVSNSGRFANTNTASVFHIGFTNTASNNSVLVNDGGQLFLRGDLRVGNFGSGNSVSVSSGGTAVLSNTSLGFQNNSSNNSMLVTGTDSRLTNNGWLRVGGAFNTNNNQNSLIVSNGGVVVVVGTNQIGASRYSSNNSVLVTGANSFLTNSDELLVGEFGDRNSLVVSNGGTVQVAGFTGIGYSNVATDNSVLVTGTDSRLASIGTLYVGYAGANSSLTISNGGAVESYPVFIGAEATSLNNSALVTGANSSLAATGQLFVGYGGGSNSLTISDGASATVVATSDSEYLSLGEVNGSSGNTLTVTGASTLSVNVATNSSYGVRIAGSDNSSNNAMVVSAGGKVYSGGSSAIGTFTGALNNSVLVTGTGSLWTNNGLITVGGGSSGQGTLTVTDGGTLASTGITLAADAGSSGTLNIGSFGGSDTAGTLIAPTIAFGAGTGAINFNQSNSTTLSAAISGNGWVNQLGIGTTILSASNSYTGGTWISGGTLTAGNLYAFGTGAVTIGLNTFLNLSNYSIANTLTNNGGTILNAGTISGGDFTGGTTDLSGDNSTVAEVTGTATVNVAGSGTTITNVAGGTVNVNGADTTIQSYNGGDVTVGRGLIVAMNDGTSSGVISGSGGMNKSSAGVLTLGGVNTYTGATTVGAGKLVVNGSISDSAVTVQSGGTLGGSGTVGALTVESGGTINPGNSPGTLNIAGNIDWLGGGNYNWQIAGVTGTAGTVSTWDLVSATGVLDLTALNIGSKFNINLWSLQSTGPDVSGAVTGFDNTLGYTWKIATAAGGITGFNSSYFNLNTGAINGTAGFANGLAGGSFSLAQSGNDLNLVFTAAAPAVPEPGTWAAAALLAGGAAFMRWRKRAKVS